MMKTSLIASAIGMLLMGGVARAEVAPLPANDYADKASWLCWPGAAANACQVDLDTTVIRANGSITREKFAADPHPPIDCFYVYPTVSNDPDTLSTMAIEPEERRVVTQQFARFGASCRLFAPMYRQFTLTALRKAMLGGSAGAGPRPITPYTDVRDAWNYYLAHENHGRGVVLIGHSQGSGVLTQLIKSEIDGKAAQARLVSAILMGTSLVVPKGAEVGGDFTSIPLCHAQSQTGCVIAYASFRETSPPPANSKFGRPRAPTPGSTAACVNPASLGGGSGPLHSYFPSGAEFIAADAAAPKPWVQGKTISTPFVSVPGLLTAHCVSTPEFNYLAIHVNADQPGPRAHDIPGDIVVMGHILNDWGLHLIDANLAMGNLVEVVHDEGRAWVAKHPLKLLLLGRRGSINHWLEDAADAFRGDCHAVEIGVVRHATVGHTLRRALIQPMAAEIAAHAARFQPSLVLVVGGFHAPIGVVEALRERGIGAPIVGWVGDAFGAEAAPLAALYDLVAHTDSALDARHRALGFASPTVWLPHAANPHRSTPSVARGRDMVFVAAASAERRRVVEALAEPISIYGPGWASAPGRNRILGGRIPHRRLAAIYAGHAASLNLRNADNVLAGLNQRNFDPYLFGAAVVGDDQPDLSRCFEPGVETLVFRSVAELDALHDRLKHDSDWIAAIAAKGLARIHAEHTFAHRLNTLLRVLA